MGQIASLEWSDPTVLLAVAAVLAAVVYLVFFRRKSEPQFVSYTSIKKPMGVKKNDAGAADDKDTSKPPITFLVGSQTGTAEEYARRLARDANRLGFRAKVVDLEDYDPESLADEKFAFFCIATYGEGEPTDSSTGFINWLMDDSRAEDSLQNVKFTLFSLGNKTYQHYQAIGRKVDRRLQVLGAKAIFPRGEGDDDGTLEEDFSSWQEKAWPALCAEFGVEYNDAGADSDVVERRYKVVVHQPGTVTPAKPILKPIGIPDAKAPYWARVVTNRELHAPGSDRSCRHVEFEIKGSGVRYDTGDHLGIYPENDPVFVEQLARRLGVDLDSCFTMTALQPTQTKKSSFPAPCSMKDAFTRHCDISGPVRKATLLALAQYASDEKERANLLLLGGNTEAGKSAFNKYIKADERSVLEVLEDHPSVKPDVGHFLEILPHMQVRYYSISSSPKMNAEIVSITAVVTRYQRPCGVELRGVCTNFLARIANQPDIRVPIFARASAFKLPKLPETPIVMVGPGTGLAPFRGFIQDRQVLKQKVKIGDAILFFGCRNEHDYLYCQELQAARDNGVVSDLQVAFSRATQEKVYVQNLMSRQKAAIWDILGKRKGHFYVCGDASHMAKDVSAQLHAIARECGSMDEKGAEAWVNSLNDEHRLHQDVW
eukprot:TRINITY_DN3789_c0_g1_i1.p1 TRINITY_DN3789_c0_g1~~TRINITY_DN3789_c0_g1_i1.p1  ORF type:complete len:656 (+),score=112.52 TRINITY_DN3789_c0_g1_i1:74-2041(+)